jgi:hypothetical protein
MKLESAKMLANAILRAVAAAEADGKDEIDMDVVVNSAAVEDDKAREALQRAIDEAEKE